MIGEILVEKGILTPGLVNLGLDSQKFYGGRVGSILVELEALSEKDLLEALCEQKSAKPAKAGQLKSVAKATLDLIPVKIAQRYQVIPLARDNRRLSVAISDPSDLLALDELAFVTGCVIEPMIASERTILNALEKYYGVQRKRPDTVRTEAVKAAVAKAREEAGLEAPPPVFSQATAKAAADQEDSAEVPAAQTEEARKFWADEMDDEAAAKEAIADAGEADEADEETTVGPGTAPPAEELADGNALLLDDAAETVDDASETMAMEEEVEVSLEEASRRLSRVDIRDDIADVLMWCTNGLFSRSALFIFQKSRTIGWTGQGEGLRPEMVRKVNVPVEDVSVFTLVRDQPKHYLGPMPETPGNEGIVEAFGGERPPAVLCVPFGINKRAIGCFYAEDSLEELQGIDLGMLFKLLQKAGLALEMLLIRTKIVMH
jgi:hypothetical protein